MATPTIQNNGQYTTTIPGTNGTTPAGVASVGTTGVGTTPTGGFGTGFGPTPFPAFFNPALFQGFIPQNPGTLPWAWNNSWNHGQSPWGFNPWNSTQGFNPGFQGTLPWGLSPLGWNGGAGFNGVQGSIPAYTNTFNNSSNTPFNTPFNAPFNTPFNAPFNTPFNNSFNTPFQSPFSGSFNNLFNTPFGWASHWINQVSTTPAWWNATQNGLGTVGNYQNTPFFGFTAPFGGTIQNTQYPWNAPSFWNNTTIPTSPFSTPWGFNNVNTYGTTFPTTNAFNGAFNSPFNSPFNTPFANTYPVNAWNTTPWSGNPYAGQYSLSGAIQNAIQNCAALGGDCVCPPGACYGVQNTTPTFGVPFGTTQGVPFGTTQGVPFGTTPWTTPNFNQAFNQAFNYGFNPGFNYGFNYGFNPSFNYGLNALTGTPSAFFGGAVHGGFNPVSNSFPAYGSGYGTNYGTNYGTGYGTNYGTGYGLNSGLSTGFTPGYNIPVGTYGPISAHPVMTPGVHAWAPSYFSSFQGYRPLFNTGAFPVGGQFPYGFIAPTPSVLASVAGSTGQIPVSFPYATNPNNPFATSVVQNAFGVNGGVSPSQTSGPTLVGCCREAA